MANAEKATTSWTRTLALAADQWSQSHVPALYVQQLCEAAEKSLAKQSKTIASISAGNPQRQAIETRIAELRQRAGQLRQAAETENLPAALAARDLIAEDHGGSPADGGRRP